MARLGVSEARHATTARRRKIRRLFIDEVRKADLGRCPGDADGSDEQIHALLLQSACYPGRF